MSCGQRRHGSVTARNAARAYCWGEEPVDLVDVIEDALGDAAQLGALDDERTRDTALTVALAVAHQLLHADERLDDARDRIVSAVALTAVS